MIRAIWIGSAAALLCTGLALGEQPTQRAPTYTKGDTITLQESDKGETKVKVIKVTPGADGKMTYEVEDVKTGDKATISDSPLATPTAPAVTEAAQPRKKGLFRYFSKPFRMSRKKETLPEAVPHDVRDAAKQNIETQIITPLGELKETPAPQLKPASGTMPKATTKPKKVPMSKAPATNWQQSWGKADDHRAPAMNQNQTIQPASYDLACANDDMQARPMMSQESADGVLTYPLLGNPYWRVPGTMKTAEKPGIAKVSK